MNFSEAAKELVPAFDQIYDQWAKDSTSLSADFQAFHPLTQIQCKKGCGACCHFPLISVTAGEAFVVLVKLIGSGQTLAQVTERISPYVQIYLEKVSQSGGLPFTNEMQKEFLKKPEPCPFFIKTPIKGANETSLESLQSGHCGIFNIRPNVCESYHSTDHPSLCAQKLPHGMMDSLVARTDDTIVELRHAERSLFGRSTMGHFPLLLAGLCTGEGMSAFLQEVELEPETDEQGDKDWATAQHMADFDLYVELLQSIGYKVTTSDLHNLIKAQNDLEEQSSLLL